VSAFAAALSSPPRSEGASDPHRLRVASLLVELGRGDAHRMPLSALVRLAYDLECMRCPSGASFDLSRVDQLAWVAAELGKQVDWRWGRALLWALGPLPAGAYATVDGCLAMVFDGREPAQPQVLVAGQVKRAAGEVRLHSAIGMTPWTKPSAG
jgi:hypothetical protein